MEGKCDTCKHRFCDTDCICIENDTQANEWLEAGSAGPCPAWEPQQKRFLNQMEDVPCD